MSDYREISPDPVPGLSNLTHHCILHAVEGIAPHGINEVLPQSGSHNISSFCRELAKVVRDSSKHKAILLYEEELVSALIIQNFYSGVFTESQFAMELEKALVDSTDVFGVELDALHRICWVYYREAKKSIVSFPKWLTGTCTYRLWLVFNQCIDDSSTCRMSPVTMNEVLKRIIELCSYTWNDKYDVDPEERKDLSFPEFLVCITDYFDRFNLDMSLTCEVIADLVDETVNGVLKKGFLEKKGHRRRNWNRRWFVLKHTILMYYSKDKEQLKGQLVLNGQTEVRSLPDKGSRKYMFLVTCGATQKPFSISTDDQKMKHDWMLAIKKAIALARLTEDGEVRPDQRKEMEEALSGFFLLKYGTQQPYLQRQDSNIQQMKHFTTKRKFQTIARITKMSEEGSPTALSPQNGSVGEGEEEVEEEVEEKEEYVAMRPRSVYDNQETFESDTEDEEGYCRMERTDFTASYNSSVSGGYITPGSLGDDTPSELRDTSVFSEKKTSPDKPTENGPQELTEQVRKTSLTDDLYYEECVSSTPRYVPGERYADVVTTQQLEEANSPLIPRAQKTTPTHTPTSPLPPSSLPSSPTSSATPNTYLTILASSPSPKTTPPPEEPVKHTTRKTVLGPPVPPRRSTSPIFSRPPRIVPDSDLPPVPPPRTFTNFSPPVSPTSPVNPVLTPPPLPVHHRKHSEPLGESRGHLELSMSIDDKEDVAQYMKRYRSSGDLDPISESKPIPPPRQH